MQREDDAATAHGLPAWLEKRQAREEEIEIAEKDADIAALFFALGTQWRRCPMTAARTGLDYAAIRPTAALVDVIVTTDVMLLLQEMEIAALEAWSRGAKR